MVIAGLPGARRKPLDIETTESGVVHHYSFEIGPDKVFWISGVLVAPDAGGPFRGDGTWQLAPTSGAYVVGAAAGAREQKLRDAGLGLGGALFFAGVIFALSFIPYVGPVFWVLLSAVMALMVFGESSAARPSASAPAATEPAPPTVRVATPGDERAPEEEGEADVEDGGEATKDSRA